MHEVVRRGSCALLLSAALVACERTASGAPDDDVPAGLRAAMAARTIYPAKREEWRSDITTLTDSTMEPRVFRASRATVALLQASPSRISQFELNRHGMLLSTRPARIDSVLNTAVPRDLVAPTELSRPTSAGNVDVFDSATSTLMRETIGGFLFRRELPLLRGGSGRICTLAPATLLHVRQLGARRTLEAFTLTAYARDDSLVGRHRIVSDSATRIRFGNGDAQRCLLIAGRELFVVSAQEDANAGVAPKLALLKPPGGRSPAPIDSTTVAAPRDSARLLQPFVVDAAVVDGGYAVLVGVNSDRHGRIVDYYDDGGKYIQSAMLPFTAATMSGTGPRVLFLHRDAQYRWWLSSWLTPMAARGAEPPPDPPRVDQAPERQLFEPPSARASRPPR